jgi:hypothetical protein
MALPCVNPNLVHFVNRENELDFLIDKISFPIDQINGINPDERVVHLVGKFAVGKSLLLCKYHNRILDRENTLSIILSLDDYSNLSGENFIFRVLNFLYTRIASLLGNQLLNTARMSTQEIANTVLLGLGNLQRRNNVALLVDEVSVLSPDQVELLEDYFLAGCLKLPRIVLILTGRNAVSGWKDFSLRPTARNNIIELFGFNLDNTQEQIEMLNPQAIDLAPKIHEISGGSPGINKIILTQASDGNPTQFNELEALHACNQELYDAVADFGRALPPDIAAELLPALEALCVLQDFDKEYEMPVLLRTHASLGGVWDAKRSASLLNILSRIQVGPGRLVDWDKGKSAYAMEEQIRDTLEKELKIRDKDLWRTLHCTAMKTYAQWAKDYDSDIFASKLAHHRTQLVAAGFDPDHC